MTVEYVRTPDDRFAELPDFPYELKHLEIDGLRQGCAAASLLFTPYNSRRADTISSASRFFPIERASSMRASRSWSVFLA